MRQPSDRGATRVEAVILALPRWPARGESGHVSAHNPAQAIEIGGTGAARARSELRHARATAGAEISSWEDGRRTRPGRPWRPGPSQEPERLGAGEQHGLARAPVGDVDLQHQAALDALVVGVDVLDLAVEHRLHGADLVAPHQAPDAAVQRRAELDVAEVLVGDERER